MTYSCPSDDEGYPEPLDLRDTNGTYFEFSYAVSPGIPFEECTLTLDMSYATALSGGPITVPDGADTVSVFFTDGSPPDIASFNRPADGFFSDGILDLAIDLDVSLSEESFSVSCRRASEMYYTGASLNVYESPDGTHYSLSVDLDDLESMWMGDDTLTAGFCEISIGGYESMYSDNVDVRFRINWRTPGAPVVASLPWVEVPADRDDCGDGLATGDVVAADGGGMVAAGVFEGCVFSIAAIAFVLVTRLRCFSGITF